MSSSEIKAVVLAAGKGTRLQDGESDTPKVMRLALGKPLLRYVLDSLDFIEREDTIIIVGYKKEKILDEFSGYRFVVQEEQLGTGHAVMTAQSELAGYSGAVLVCYGDMPAIRKETYAALIRAHFDGGNDCTILTGESSFDLPYGRVIRAPDGSFIGIVEDRDCTPAQSSIKELNSGVYVFSAPLLLESLKLLKNDNSQSEYYITDAPSIMGGLGARVSAFRRELGPEILGVNTVLQLEQVEAVLRG
ncbi:MAG: NTP transferase domain-containing protein [Oscillospiraceae bacterium]|nr:NTP transferase domain-containing protein [Oscillospiraceae bacterium]